MIEGRLTDPAGLLARLQAMPAILRGEIAGRLTALATALQQHVQRDKLSGQLVAVRSGRLRDSIRVAVTDDGPAIGARIFSDAPQAARLEFGWRGNGTPAAALRSLKQRFVLPLRQGSRPPAGRDRPIDLAPRPFLRSALDDMASEIEAGLAARPVVELP